MNEIENLNRTLFLHINAGNETPTWLIQFAIIIADWLIYLIPLLLIALWLWGEHDNRRLAAKACLVTFLALGVNQLISLYWIHPRPFMLDLGHAWLNHVAESSFPSDHATVFAGVGVTLLFGGATRLAGAVLLTGAAVAWARVFLGVHFPLDIVGAIAVAGFAYGAVTLLWQVLGEPLVDHFERLYRILLAWPIKAGWMHH